MGRRKRNGLPQGEGEGECESSPCQHGGTCTRVSGAGAGAGEGRRACACAGAWGGAHCSVYVGHDHACRARCALPALCVWGPDVSATEAGAVACVCPAGARCVAAGAGARARGGAGAGGAGGAHVWAGLLAALAALGAAVAVAALYYLYRRRHVRFSHARLPDNVEISNPMYLAGEDELDPAPPAALTGGNHFANPVYESMYAAQQNNPPAEEHATLLADSGRDSAPPDRAALL